MTDIALKVVSDRITTRIWELDLSLAGAVATGKIRPAKRKRQKIAAFLGREGTKEHFAIRQTIPYCGYEAECPPTQSQYGAVSDFFQDCCETRHQAHTLLCARDYAEVVAKRFKFPADRRRLVWLSAAAFILADKELRSRVRSWNAKSGYGGIEAGIAYQKPFKQVTQFAAKLIDDMRGAGSEIFG